MKVITDENAAQRLARAIWSDIGLYNQDKIDSGEDVSAELKEGLELFNSRVSSNWHSVFREQAPAWANRYGYGVADEQSPELESELLVEKKAVSKLAMALWSDLSLYNQDKIDSGADLADEISDAKMVFQSKVPASLYYIFGKYAPNWADRFFDGGNSNSPSSGPGSPIDSVSVGFDSDSWKQSNINSLKNSNGEMSLKEDPQRASFVSKISQVFKNFFS